VTLGKARFPTESRVLPPAAIENAQVLTYALKRMNHRPWPFLAKNRSEIVSRESEQLVSLSRTSDAESNRESLSLKASHRSGSRSKVPFRKIARARRFDLACLLIPTVYFIRIATTRSNMYVRGNIFGHVEGNGCYGGSLLSLH
jgi:hypothetical protein